MFLQDIVQENSGGIVFMDRMKEICKVLPSDSQNVILRRSMSTLILDIP